MATTLILLFVAGIANAMMDVLKSQWHASPWQDLPIHHWWYQWAGPQSHSNKWKYGIRAEGERFFLSSTALVFITDGWHFFQFIWGTCFVLGIVMYQHVWWLGPVSVFDWFIIPVWAFDFIILKTVYLIAFNIFYEKVFR